MARTLKKSPGDSDATDALLVQSVEKAFRVLQAFDAGSSTLGLTQIAEAVNMDKSAAQRFSHTLVKLGYLRKDPNTKRFELTAKTLGLGYLYSRSNALIQRATPYLLHLSKTTEETINLTVMSGANIIFVSRFMSRHVLHTGVIVGSSLPAYCTAPGRAMLSRLPNDEAADILARSDLRPITPLTTFRVKDLRKKLDEARMRGYATAFEECYRGDLSVAAPVVDDSNRPVAAVNIAVSSSRFSPAEMEEKFALLAVAAARSISGAQAAPAFEQRPTS
jgi:DNA-binding IclR family transcriptional regulator